MRPLTSSEKNLSLLLGGALFLAANLLGGSFYLRKSKLLRMEIDALKNRRIEASVWIEEKELWESRAKWIADNQPRRPESGDPSSNLLEEIQRTAREHQLQILEQSLQDPVKKPSVFEVAIRLKVGGSFENIVLWLASLQKPAAFLAVPSFTLKSDKEPPNVICDLLIARWHAPAKTP